MDAPIQSQAVIDGNVAATYILLASTPVSTPEGVAFIAAYEQKAYEATRRVARYVLNATGLREGERRTDYPQPTAA